jgi:hypothetical protein
MDGSTGGAPRRLRAVGEAGAPAPEALEEALLACLAAAPGGLAARALVPALAERLGTTTAGLPAREVQVALGLLVATGRVDEASGRLVLVEEERRRAG